MDIRSVRGGLLVQDKDVPASSRICATKVVTERQPTKHEMAAMLFGWRVVKHVKSNAIVYAGADRTLGIGAGQMSRVDASRIAVWKAEEAGLRSRAAPLRATHFFHFPMDSSPPPMPARPAPFNPAAPCATMKSSPPPTSATWR